MTLRGIPMLFSMMLSVIVSVMLFVGLSVVLIGMPPVMLCTMALAVSFMAAIIEDVARARLMAVMAVPPVGITAGIHRRASLPSWGARRCCYTVHAMVS